MNKYNSEQLNGPVSSVHITNNADITLPRMNNPLYCKSEGYNDLKLFSVVTTTKSHSKALADSISYASRYANKKRRRRYSLTDFLAAQTNKLEAAEKKQSRRCFEVINNMRFLY